MKTLHLLFIAALAHVAGVAHAVTFTRLTSTWSVTPTGFQAGFTQIAANDRYVMVGVPLATVNGQATAGAVQVYTASGIYKRLLKLPAPVAGDLLGFRLAISGGLGYATAEAGGTGRAGSVYVFDLGTGALVKKLVSPALAANDGFGRSIAVGSGFIAVGESMGNGRVWLFNSKTYSAESTPLEPSAPVSGAGFGASCSIEGNLLLVGASLANGSAGAGYLFNIADVNRPEIAAFPQAGIGSYGAHCLLHQGYVFLGSIHNSIIKMIDPRRNTTRDLSVSGNPVLSDALTGYGGAVMTCSTAGIHLFNISSDSNTPENTFSPPGGSTGEFGKSAALFGDRLYLGDPADDVMATDAGAVWMAEGSQRLFPLSLVARKGDLAPGTAGAKFGSFKEACINSDAEVAFTAGLSGPDSGSSTHSGLWNDLSGSLAIAGRTGTPVGSPNIQVSSFNRLMMNSQTSHSSRLVLKGSEVSTASNQAVTVTDSNTIVYARTNNTPYGGGGVVKTLGQQSQSMEGSRIAYHVKYKTTTTAADSGIIWLDYGALTTRYATEGDVVDGFTNMGEINNHFALTGSSLLFSAGLYDGTTTSNGGLFMRTSYVNTAGTPIVRKGVTGVPGPTGFQASSTFFSTFVSESADTFEFGAFRATLKGLGVTAATSEGVYRISNNLIGTAPTLQNEIVRKGVAIPEINNLKVSRINGFWSAYTQTIVHVGLSGTGVTTATDGAVILGTNGTTAPLNHWRHVLMREGDYAPGCHPAKIGTILKVEVDPTHGHYFILATLTGAPLGTELALFRGFSAVTVSQTDDLVLCNPVCILRKGDKYLGGVEKVSSLTFLANNRATGGGGTVGMGQVMQVPPSVATPSEIILQINLSDGSVNLGAGKF